MRWYHLFLGVITWMTPRKGNLDVCLDPKWFQNSNFGWPLERTIWTCVLSKFKFWRYSLVRVQYHEPRVCTFIRHLGVGDDTVSFRIKLEQMQDPLKVCATGFQREPGGLESGGYFLQRPVRIEVRTVYARALLADYFLATIGTCKSNNSLVTTPWSWGGITNRAHCF